MINWAKIFLWPFSLIYGAIMLVWDIYWRLSPRVKLPCKIISVGNIVAGGAGKTPLVIYIARMAIAAGYKTAIVARGYKRKSKELLEVTADSDWHEVGDEPLEIYRQIPEAKTYVDKSKKAAAQRACDDGAQIIIVDDGFQHRRLARDIDIVCLDNTKPFGRGGLLPYGLQREPIRSLNRADAIVFTSITGESIASDTHSFNKPRAIFRSKSQVITFINLKTGQQVGMEYIRNLRIMAFCGLANPQKFRIELEKTGIKPARFLVYKDHHGYTDSDIEYLINLAQNEQTGCLLTTSKDAVKLESFDFGTVQVYYAQMSIKIDDRESFKRFLGL
jgi:tetraacyldisaccharide 4'-kinase